MLQRGQLPLFIPNYYRGAFYQYPDEAGKSSHLFNTGTVAWFYRCLIENLFGVVGCKQGLRIAPQLPDDWQSARITRKFRGATFNLTYSRNSALPETKVIVDGQVIEDRIIRNIQADKTFEVKVELPSH